MNDKELFREALKAREMSYSPYSNYSVGAALLTKDGLLFTGCNIENAAYGPSNCAERTAIFKAVSEGCKEFSKIAIVGGRHGEKPSSYAYPCGVCRQVMEEFCDSDFEIIVGTSGDDIVTTTLGELLPKGFGKANL